MKSMIALALALCFLPFGGVKAQEPPPALVKAIARQESGLNPLAVNVAGKSYYPATREEAERLIAAGETDARALEEGIAAFIRSEPLARPEVVAVRDPETLAEIDKVGDRPVLLLLFVRFGGTKLLDNRVLGPQNAKKVA